MLYHIFFYPGEDATNQQRLHHQIELWKKSNKWQNFPINTQILYSLLAQIDPETWTLPLLSREEEQGEGPENEMSWLRGLGLCFWYGYGCQNASLHRILRIYTSGFQQNYLKSPKRDLRITSRFSEESEKNGDEEEGYEDVMFGLLHVLIDHPACPPLQQVLSPLTHTESPLDYSLSFLVFDLLRNITPGKCGPTSFPVAELIMNFATQLELIGFWTWAIYILTYASSTYFPNRNNEQNNLENPNHNYITQTQSLDLINQILTRYVLFVLTCSLSLSLSLSDITSPSLIPPSVHSYPQLCLP